MSLHIHICDYCKTGPFCDCGRINADDSTFNMYPVHTNQLQLFYDKYDDNMAVHRLNNIIMEDGTWNREDTTSWTAWIATGKTLLRATLLKIKLASFLNSLTGR
jgi:hypothetical protein